MTGEAFHPEGCYPGVLRPMPALNGLLVRLKISGGAVTSAALRGIAQAGRTYGDGLFDLSARANLQLRGLREEQLSRLIDTLSSLGISGDSASPEAARNVLVSPLSGLDGREDALAAAKAVETVLAASKDLHALPANFGIIVDDGSALSLAGTEADVRFDWDAGRQLFAVGIGGRAYQANCLGHCSASQISPIAARLARAFLRIASQLEDPPRRMRGLAARCGAGAIAAFSRLRLHPRRNIGAIEEPCPIGFLRFNGNSCFGAGAPFGRLDAGMLDAAAGAAENFAAGEIRLTPWRAIILPLVEQRQVDAIRAHFAAHGFIVDREDARLAAGACGGSCTCVQGATGTRSDALPLMPAARRVCSAGAAPNVSGCAKSCGEQPDAPFSLVARAGLYDLIANSAELDASIGSATELTLAEVREMLAAIARRAGRQRRLEQP